jgi:HEAT repeat protein
VALGDAGVPALTWGLRKEDSPVKRVLLGVMAKVPGLALPLVPASRYHAASLEALARLGPKACAAMPVLVEALQRPGAELHGEGFQAAFVAIGPTAIEPLTRAIRSLRPAAARYVLAAWGELLTRAEVDPETMDAVMAEAGWCLAASDEVLVAQAALLLARLGPRASQAVPALVRVLEAPEMRMGPAAHAAILALGQIGAGAEVVVPALVVCLGEPDIRLRQAAAAVLGAFGPAASLAVPPLARALWYPDDHAFSAVAEALGRIGSAATDAAPELVRGLDHGAAFVRAVAALNLSRVQPDPVLAVPALVNALRDEDHFVRAQAAAALGRLGPAAATPALTALLADAEEAVQIAAIEALGAIGPAASGAATELRRARSNRQAGLGRYVLAALDRIEPPGEGAD